MAVLSVAQARQYAQQAGFGGQSLNIIVAIAQAESGLNTSAQHINGDGSIDRGIVQINDRAHPDVSNVCAYEPLCAFQAAYRISSSGNNFTPWTTYTSGAYLRYLQSTSSGGQQSGSTPWYDGKMIHGYYPSYDSRIPDTPHQALDFYAPLDTPFFFLEPGTIKKADYQSWGGEVFLQPDDKSRPEEYVYHLDEINTSVGEHVQAGQVIGLSGGQNVGGHHPTIPEYSTVTHVHFGEFTHYEDTPIGPRPFGPDPSPLIAQAKQNGVGQLFSGLFGDNGSTTLLSQTSGSKSASTPVPLAAQVNELLSEFPGFSGIAIALDKVETFPGIIWYNPGDTIQIVPSGSVGDLINGFASAVFDPSDYIGAAMRSVLDTIVSNLIPLAVRTILVIVGLLIIFALLTNAINASGAPQLAGQFAKIGEMAA